MSVAKTLGFTLYIGAARADATPEQVDRLKTGVMSELDLYRRTGDDRPIRKKILEIMGENWEPSGDWKRTIDALGL